MLNPEVTWRVLLQPSGAGAWNMAVDHALALALGPREGVLRFYGWSTPTLSLGRNEPAEGVWDPARLRATGTALVRRPTGGRAVLHHREVTYSVVAPLTLVGGPRRAFRSIHDGILKGLAELGVPARLTSSGTRSLPPDAGPCFRHPAPGEIATDLGKLVGSAQVRMGGMLLQHGSILLEGSQESALLRLRVSPGSSGAADPSAGAADSSLPRGRDGASDDGDTSLTSVLGRTPSAAEVTGAVLRGLVETLPGEWASYQQEDLPGLQSERLSAREGTLARGLLIRYQSPAWTWFRREPGRRPPVGVDR